MNKPELIAEIANRASTTKKEAEAFINAFIDVTAETLKSGDKVALVGFGTFSVRERKTRSGVNPRTREKIEIPAKTVPYFKPGKTLKDAVK